jgi:photosystem II stability/assembly factor-like uncharacterized protein
MIRHPLRLLVTLLLLGLGAIAGAQQPKPDVPPSQSDREKQVAEIQKQIEELNRKLDALKKSDAAAKPATPATPAEGPFSADWAKSLSWRALGPANMGGRIVALSVFEADPTTYFVATGGGGLLRTVNNGVTFEHLFDKESTVAIGDVCVAPSNKDIVWVGTGENNPRNSVSYGDGVYKSADGGKTWTNMGLKETFQIGKVVVHPKNPDIVYVGALGRLWGTNPDRGLYKTTDGGKTWSKILFVDDKTGVIDIRVHPTDPETLLVATWERQRDLFDVNEPIKKHAPGSAIYKTTDGGKTFRKLTKGLPDVNMGRIGLDYYRKDPNIVFAIVDSAQGGNGPPVGSSAFLGVRFLGSAGNVSAADETKLAEVVAGGPADKAGLKVGDVLVAFGEKPVARYADIEAQMKAVKPGDKVKLKVKRGDQTLDLEATLGGLTPQAAAQPDVYIGVTGDVEDAGAAKLGEVVAGGPADKAGLKLGDIITAVGETPIARYRDLSALIRTRKPGEKATLKVRRGDQAIEIQVTFELRPPRVLGGGSEGPMMLDPSRPFGSMLGGQIENAQDRQGPDGWKYGGVYKSTDGGENWTRINSLNPRPMYFSQVRVDPSDDKYVYVLGIAFHRSDDGGKTFRGDGGRNVHADGHALWIDPRDGRHMLLGCDGGIYSTYDRMNQWDHHNQVAIGQFYHVALDTRRPYNVYGGLQDNGSWGGPSYSRTGGAINEDWFSVGFGDGFKCQVDQNDPDQIYWTSQNGNLGRRSLKTGEVNQIRPIPERGKTYRFNWNTPFYLSHQNSRVYYAAGNYVFRSLDRGNNLKVISPSIARTDQGTASSFGESPRNPDVLYVGTDDGLLWGTTDGGKTWADLTPNVKLAGPRYVSTIEPSRYEEGRVYACFDGHRSDVEDPLIFVSQDFGKTWKPIRGNLPHGSTKCLREDIQNPDVLWLGTEFAVWASVDRGSTWSKINGNLPTVAVLELAQHPTAGEIVAATHGRSLWALEAGPIRQSTPAILKEKAHLYRPTPATRFRNEPPRGTTNRKFVAQNPPNGATIYVNVATKPEKVALKVIDDLGATVKEIRVPTDPGLHRLNWDLLRTITPDTVTPPSSQGGFLAGIRRGMANGPRLGLASPGSYRVILTVDGNDQTQPLKIEADPLYPPSDNIAEDLADEEDEEELERRALRTID